MLPLIIDAKAARKGRAEEEGMPLWDAGEADGDSSAERDAIEKLAALLVVVVGVL